MSAAVLDNYLRSLINLFFKILPLKESGERSLETYMKSLQAELLGCNALVEAIHDDSMFLSLGGYPSSLPPHHASSLHPAASRVF